MALPPPNNPKVAKIATVGHRDTRLWVNTFHVAKDSGPLVAADLQTIADTMVSFLNNYRAIWPTNIQAEVVQVRKLDPLDPLALDEAIVPPLVGLRGGQASPANVSLSLSERTGLAGRKFRGRFYCPGLSEQDLTADDRIGSGAVSVMNAIIAQYIAQWASTTLIPVIFHKADNTYTQVIAGVIEAVLDSQRRRLPERGR